MHRTYIQHHSLCKERERVYLYCCVYGYIFTFCICKWGHAAASLCFLSPTWGLPNRKTDRQSNTRVLGAVITSVFWTEDGNKFDFVLKITIWLWAEHRDMEIRLANSSLRVFVDVKKQMVANFVLSHFYFAVNFQYWLTESSIIIFPSLYLQSIHDSDINSSQCNNYCVPFCPTFFSLNYSLNGVFFWSTDEDRVISPPYKNFIF